MNYEPVLIISLVVSTLSPITKENKLIKSIGNNFNDLFLIL